MNIESIIKRVKKYDYLDKVESALSHKGLTLNDLKSYERIGRAKDGETPDTIFTSRYGKHCQTPTFQRHCLCGHRIQEQCYLCPEGSKNVCEIVVVGNHCIKTWGFNNAVRGDPKSKIECDLCGSMVSKKGMAKHKKTMKCKNNRKNNNDNDTESTRSSDSV